MAKFRKRPVVVEAVQWFDDGDHEKVERAWLRADGNISLAPDVPNLTPIFAIPTREGWRQVIPGSWIITGKGEISLCGPEIFDIIYEPAPPFVVGELIAPDARDG